jgi:transcriptional regulator with XRE-family HTH domain
MLKVREIAEKQGYNIDRLSKKANVSYDTVLKYWHDQVRRLDVKTLQKLAKALDVSANDLVDLDE